jgi:predicted O-methyltransferase YrrM
MKTVTNAQVMAVPGWFGGMDVEAFRSLLAESAAWGSGGDLAELGVYHGKSAVLIGSYLAPGEIFTVIDLFGANAEGAANSRENTEQYLNLTRTQFETAYEGIHGELPVVVQGLSSAITDHASHGTHRFVHIDASHLYENVVQDLAAARTLLKPDGVVVLDDYRTEHTPGVAAAAWQAVGKGLHPFLLTPAKMYATWGDPEPWQKAVDDWLNGRSDDFREQQLIGGNQVTRVWSKDRRLARFVPPVVLPALSKLRARIAK